MTIPKPDTAHDNRRALRVATIAFVVVEAIAMIPLVLNIASR